jgi:undecaprenyl-diphosphatase
MDFDLLAIDRDVFLFLNGKHNDFWDIVMYWASRLELWVPLAFLFSYVLIKNFNVENKTGLILNVFLISVLAIFHFVICVKIMPAFFENFVQRERPCYDVDLSTLVHLVGGDCSEHFGFFAPRSCLAFSIVTFLFFSIHDKHKWFKGLLFLWALFVSYSRIYVGAHYPGNILVSALIGVFIGFLLYRIFFYIKNSVLAI